MRRETLTWQEKERWDELFKREWVRLHPGVDYPREVDWLEVKRLFGGAIMAVGMG